LQLACRGVVQGLGARPALHHLAAGLRLRGRLLNTFGALQIDLAGPREALEAFVRALPAALPGEGPWELGDPSWLEAPEPPWPEGVELESAGVVPLGRGFFAPGLSADRAPCPRCLAELADGASRRHRYPFISCCDCGPRFSLATALPFCRAHTTLATFPPCPACAREFSTPGDRRFHAETISCPHCGPRLSLWDGAGEPMAGGEAALTEAATLLQNHFTVGIDDDLTHHSLLIDDSFQIDADDEVRAVFYGLGSDGTVGANKATIKIIAQTTPLYAQGYFVYDSKKSGSLTVSHLRFGPRPIRAPYLITRPTLVAVHQWDLLAHLEGLQGLVPGGTLLLNSPYTPADTWRQMPPEARRLVRNLGARVWQINAHQVAREAGLGPRINTVMQAAFFAVSGVLPREEALERIRDALRHSYSRKGEVVVQRNLQALDASLAALQPLQWEHMELQTPEAEVDQAPAPGELPAHLEGAPPFVREVIAPMLAYRGDALPVSALPCDGTWPTGTARWEKRNLASEVPVWESDLCVQCGKCVMVCPHAVIRAKVASPEVLEGAPAGFREAAARDPVMEGQRFTIQVAVEDCTGCQLCVEVCPARDRQEPKRKALNMAPQRPLREEGRVHWEFFLGLPEVPRDQLNLHKIGQQQLQQPLFEFSGACAGCGETPYLKLLSQLFGDRLLIANATGCSSIYGGNLPTTPWTTNGEGRGPAWSNSLFEDNAEFGYGMRVALDQQRVMALHRLALPLSAGSEPLPPSLVESLVAGAAHQGDESDVVLQRERVGELKRRLGAALERLPVEERAMAPEAQLLDLADALVKTSVWLVGGDGWAYDIGFGGLDHVLASGRDVNALVLDTEVYSNTGGQASKATPLGAVAKFASGGKASPKKDLGLMAITQGGVYVASVAMGARDEHTLRAFLEAERYPGPSLILAYSHCIAHGIDMAKGMEHQRLAVESGRWMLYRYDPRRLEQGLSPLQIDSPHPRRPLAEAMAAENRFRMLGYSHPERARELERQAQAELQRRWAFYGSLAQASSSSSSSWAKAE
jgi:pyruvate-ferredoxin/flavodoxin oxidoreductase